MTYREYKKNKGFTYLNKVDKHTENVSHWHIENIKNEGLLYINKSDKRTENISYWHIENIKKRRFYVFKQSWQTYREHKPLTKPGTLVTDQSGWRYDSILPLLSDVDVLG